MRNDTGLQWTPLGEVASIASGSTPSRARAEFWGGHIPWVKTGEVNFGVISRTEESVTAAAVNAAKLKVFPRNTILVAMYGEGATRGRSAILGIEAATNQATAAINCHPQHMDYRYLYYFLEHNYEEVRKIGQGSNQTNLSTTSIEKLLVPNPYLPEQLRIVAALDTVADAARAIEAEIAKLRKMRQGILLASMVSVISQSPPKGWSRIALKEVVPFVEYGISDALTDNPSGIPVLRMNNIRDGQADVNNLRYCPVPMPDKLFLRRGDVLFNRTNSIDHVGKSALWRDDLPNATFASYLVRLNPDTQRLLPEYLVEWLQHPVIRQRVKAISTVAVQQVNVNPSRLRELEIDLPNDLEEQRKVINSLAACDERIRQDQEKLEKLRKLKIGLADDLLTQG